LLFESMRHIAKLHDFYLIVPGGKVNLIFIIV